MTKIMKQDGRRARHFSIATISLIAKYQEESFRKLFQADRVHCFLVHVYNDYLLHRAESQPTDARHDDHVYKCQRPASR